MSQGAVNHFFTAYPRSHQLAPLTPNPVYMPHDSLIYRTWFENENDRWKGRWIGDGGEKPLYLRRSFELRQNPVQAIVFVSGLGHYDLRVNGQAASAHVLDPGWTNYHRTVQFVAHDITSLLDEGENVLAAHLGNGFYAGDKGDRFFWPMYEDNTYVRYGNELPFLAELHIQFEDGSRDVLTTESGWKVRRSATSLANIYASEIHDRRHFPWGWDGTGFDDSDWASAKLITGPRGQLRYQNQPPLVLHETIRPIRIRTPGPGVVCYDLGQNMSTVVKVVVEGDAGSKIIVRYAESAYEDGRVKMEDPLFKEFETNVYSTIFLGGRGEPEVWSPEFSYTSARYIQVEGVSLESGRGLPVIHSVVGQHISSASMRIGSMHTDKDDVNALLQMCKWSFASNLQSLHTDCPQIEKFGWLEVTHLLAPATQYIRDVESLYCKIIDDIIDAQDPSGLVPTMAPEIRYMTGPFRDTITWGAALILLPDILQRYYGSIDVVTRIYNPAMRYLKYLHQKERRGGLIEHGLGDWGREIAFGNSQANIETAVYYQCLQVMERFARQLSFDNDAILFKEWAVRVREVYNKHLLVIDDPAQPGAYYTSLDRYPERDSTAVNQAIALQLGLVPQEHRGAVLAAFLADVADGKLRSGEVGLRYIFATLAEIGRHDIVLRMARQEEHPSYMRFLRRGETTLPEFWQDECRSKCHDMLGHIQEWFYAAVLGITPIGNAYKTFNVSPPYISEFDDISGTFNCPFGTISMDFKRQPENIVFLLLAIPLGTIAKLKLPKTTSFFTVTQNASISQHSNTDGVIELRPGIFHISVAVSSD
jgi:hypothetical protein